MFGRTVGGGSGRRIVGLRVKLSGMCEVRSRGKRIELKLCETGQRLRDPRLCVTFWKIIRGCECNGWMRMRYVTVIVRCELPD